MCRYLDAVDGENSDGEVSMSAAFENGFFSEVLVEHGYITYCIGKWHITRGEETHMAALPYRHRLQPTISTGLLMADVIAARQTS